MGMVPLPPRIKTLWTSAEGTPAIATWTSKTQQRDTSYGDELDKVMAKCPSGLQGPDRAANSFDDDAAAILSPSVGCMPKMLCPTAILHARPSGGTAAEELAARAWQMGSDTASSAIAPSSSAACKFAALVRTSSSPIVARDVCEDEHDFSFCSSCVSPGGASKPRATRTRLRQPSEPRANTEQLASTWPALATTEPPSTTLWPTKSSTMSHAPLILQL
eukprot:SM000125S26056  [mRNA]  locus=s125:31340:32292:- [translate_table: standard]